MPKKIVDSVYNDRFGKRRFKIDEETSFRIPKSKLSEMKAKLNTKRKLSRFVASIEFYDGNPFASLSSIFNVSVEAMAIRLEELNLIDFD